MAARKPIVLSSAQQEQIQSGDALQLQACVAGAASLNMPHGTAPTSPVDGDAWTTTAGIFVRINGATIGPLSAGGGGTPWWWSPPTAAALSSALSGDATNPTVSDDSNIGTVVDCKTSVVGDKLRAMVETITSPSADWTYEFKMGNTQPPNSFSTTGLWIYNTTSAKGLLFGFGNDTTLTLSRRTTTAFSATVGGFTVTGISAFSDVFLKAAFTASGATLKFYVSVDGKNWRFLGSETVASYITNNPDRIGFGAALNYAGVSGEDMKVAVTRRVKSW